MNNDPLKPGDDEYADVQLANFVYLMIKKNTGMTITSNIETVDIEPFE